VIIALALSVLFEALTPLTGGSGSVLDYYLNAAGIGQISEAVSTAPAGADSVIGSLIGSLPMILIVAGLYMTWKSAKTAPDAPVAPTGLKMVRIILLIYAVIAGLGLFLGLFSLLALVSMVTSASSQLGTVLGAIGLLVLLIGLVEVLYYAFLASSVKALIKTSQLQVPSGKISKYVIVFAWFDAVFAIVTGLLTFGTSVPGGLAGLCGGAASILLALWLKELSVKLQEF
jgi:hypothetical protein